MKYQCPICKGEGCVVDENGILKDDPCDNCAGTGFVFEDDEEKE